MTVLPHASPATTFRNGGGWCSPAVEPWSDRDLDRRLRRLAAQPVDTPAAAVRLALADARRRGADFDAAWSAALALVPVGRTWKPGRSTRSHRALHRDGAAARRRAIERAEPSYRRAYVGEPPTPGDRAVAAVVALLDRP